MSETLLRIPCYAEDADADDLSRPCHLVLERNPYGLYLAIDRNSNAYGAAVPVTKAKLREIIAYLTDAVDHLEDDTSR